MGPWRTGDAQIFPLTFTMISKNCFKSLTNVIYPWQAKDTNHRESPGSCLLDELGTLSEAEKKKPLTATLFFLQESSDLFSSFTQISSSCSQIFTGRQWPRNAASFPLHAEEALHYSPGRKKHLKKKIHKNCAKMHHDALLAVLITFFLFLRFPF